MSGALRDRPIYRPLGKIGTQDTISWSCRVPIGASGATGTLTFGPVGIAVAKSDTGVYAVTGMPVCPAAKGRVWFGIYSPTPTVGGAVQQIVDYTAGTMTFATVVGVTATEPASGDVITIFFEGESR